MLDTRFKICISAAVMLLVLSAVLPLVYIFSGGNTVFAAEPPAADTAVQTLAAMQAAAEARGVPTRVR